MQFNYIWSESTTKPKPIDVHPDAAYLHKNIRERVDDSVTPPVTIYEYEEAVLSIEEFNAFANSALMTGQEDSANNQLAIMEAFADLYEAMVMNLM